MLLEKRTSIRKGHTKVEPPSYFNHQSKPILCKNNKFTTPLRLICTSNEQKKISFQLNSLKTLQHITLFEHQNYETFSFTYCCVALKKKEI